MQIPETLLFGYGNPGRGDDALGPALVQAIEQAGYPELECLIDMQLQIEHVTDLEHRSLILFVDADMSCQAPFEYARLSAEKDDSYTSHAMTPAALLYAYRQVYGREAPAAYLLRIRGYDFGLGAPLSEKASDNSDISRQFIVSLLQDRLESHSQPLTQSGL